MCKRRLGRIVTEVEMKRLYHIFKSVSNSLLSFCTSGVAEAVQNRVRNLLLRPKFRVRKIITLLGAQAQPCGSGSAAPVHYFLFLLI